MNNNWYFKVCAVCSLAAVTSAEAVAQYSQKPIKEQRATIKTNLVKSKIQQPISLGFIEFLADMTEVDGELISAIDMKDMTNKQQQPQSRSKTPEVQDEK